MGILYFQASASGVDNLYRLRPMTDAKVHTGALHKPPVRIYNPHDEVLNVTEIYTSEGFLQLSLPRGSNRAPGGGAGKPATLWQIPPRSSKTVVSLAFKTEIPARYKGFIHLRSSRERFVVPVEIEVTMPHRHVAPPHPGLG